MLGLRRHKGSVDLLKILRLQGMQPYPQGLGCGFRLSQLRSMSGIGWIREDGHQGDLRHHFPEELQLLPHQGVSVHGHAGDVSPWPRETDDESGHYGIISGRYDDGDCLGRSFGRPDR